MMNNKERAAYIDEEIASVAREQERDRIREWAEGKRVDTYHSDHAQGRQDFLNELLDFLDGQE